MVFFYFYFIVYMYSLLNLFGYWTLNKHYYYYFQQCEMSYLGHMIDKNGLHPLKNKVEAIVNTPAPTNTTELKSFFRNVSILLEVLIL